MPDNNALSAEIIRRLKKRIDNLEEARPTAGASTPAPINNVVEQVTIDDTAFWSEPTHAGEVGLLRSSDSYPVWYSKDLSTETLQLDSTAGGGGGVTVGASGQYYMHYEQSDGTPEVWKYSPQGSVQWKSTGEGTNFWKMASDPDENYVAALNRYDDILKVFNDSDGSVAFSNTLSSPFVGAFTTGGFLFVGSLNNNWYKYDISAQTEEYSVNLGANVEAIECYNNTTAFAADASTIYKYDASNGSQLDSWTGPSIPAGMAVNPSGDRLAVSIDGTDNGIEIYDFNGNLQNSISTSNARTNIAYDSNGDYLYASSRDNNTIYRYDSQLSEVASKSAATFRFGLQNKYKNNAF